MADTPRSVAIIGTRGYPSYYGGFETAVRRIAPELAARGWSVRVYGRRSAVRPDDPSCDPSVQSIVTPGIDSTALSTLSFGLTSVLHAMVRKPDVALVMNVANGFWLPLLRLRGIRTVVNVDGIEWHRDKWSRLGKAVFKLGAWFTAKFADTLIFDAEEIGRYWRAHFGRDGVFIPYGADPWDQLPLSDEVEPGQYVLLVARFVPENTVPQFIDAAEVIARDFDVVLVGSAPEGTEIADKARRADQANRRIHWLGHVSDDRRLFALWQHAGVYFHGHSVGGTNPALVQAMTLGAKIVARDTVYNREVLGDGGTYCQPDPRSIAAAVLSAMGSDDGSRHRAFQRAREHYSWELVCQKYEHALSAHDGQQGAGNA